MKVIANNGNNIKLKVGEIYNLIAGIHVNGCGDVIYLSNMLCVDVTEEGFNLQGVPGSVGSMNGPVFVYKDEVFAVFDTDLFQCLIHC